MAVTDAQVRSAVRKMTGGAAKPRVPRRVASYAHAVRWIVANDDTEWLSDPNGILSVTAGLVADLFGRSDEEIIRDLRRALLKARGEGA